MRIASGSTTNRLYFVAVDSVDKTTRKTGLSSFTVYRSRNGATPAALSSPTIIEHDDTNMPGLYSLLLGQDTTIASGADSEEMALHISASGMEPVTRVVELFRPKITLGNTLDVASTGEAGIDFGNVLLPAGAIPVLGIVDNGTAQSASSTTLVLRSAASFADDALNGATIMITGGSAGVGQSAVITDYVGSTDTATIAAWSGGVTPTGTITYVIFGTAPVEGGGGLDAAGVRAAVGLSSANLDTQLGGIQSDTDNIQTRLPAALVSGRMDASVGAMENNVMTAAAAASDLTTELQAGLATASGVTSAVAPLATSAALATVAGYVDTEVAAIKTVTDKLDTAMELDGAVYRFTTNALEQAPAGGGGSSDWNSDERTAIRSILGIPSSGTTPDDPTVGILDTIRDGVAGISPSDIAGAVRTNLSTELGRIDVDVSSRASAADQSSIKAKTDQLTFADGYLVVDGWRMNGAPVIGNGTPGNLWRGA